MAISPQLRQFKSSGVYRLEFDKSQTSNINISTLRLLVGHSKKGPFNSPTLIENAEDFKNVYGDIDKSLEKKGMFFHRSCLAALSRGPILALSLMDFDDTADFANVLHPFTHGGNNHGSSNSTALRTLFNKPYNSFHNTDKFMTPSDASLLAITGATSNTEIIAFTNLKTTPITVIIRAAGDVDGFEITADEWYGAGNVPAYLHDKDYLSDFMVDVFVFKGKFDHTVLKNDSTYGNYFDSQGLIKSKLDAFSNLRTVTTLAKYSGSLLPGFKDMEGRSLYIESMINQEARRTGLFCAVDEEKVLLEAGTKLNLIGHGYSISANINTSALSYPDSVRKFSQTGDLNSTPTISGNTYTIAYDNSGQGVPANAIVHPTTPIAKGDYLWAEEADRLAKVLQVSYVDSGTSNKIRTYTIKTNTPISTAYYVTDPAAGDSTGAAVSAVAAVRTLTLSEPGLVAAVSAVAQVETLTLTGTGGTAAITTTGVNGSPLTATFSSTLAGTATAFVTANATAYANAGITLTSSGAGLIFTAAVAGTGFTSPTIANATTNLAGSVDVTQANVVAVVGDSVTVTVDGTDLSAIAFTSNNDTTLAAVANAIQALGTVATATVTEASTNDRVITITAQTAGTDFGAVSAVTPGTATFASAIVTANVVASAEGADTTNAVGITALKSFENYNTSYVPFEIAGATITAPSISNCLSQLTSTNLATALKDKDLIDFRYIVDTFGSSESIVGQATTILTKYEISKLAKDRQNASAILNAPTVEDFKNNANPNPQFVDASGKFNTKYIKDGGNLDLNPTTLYTLPSVADGANYAFYYAPGLLVKDAGKNITVPPAAYVSNNYIDKYTAALPWSIVAGPRRGVVGGSGVVGAEYTFDKADRDILEPFGINPIVFQRGVGLTILGNKTAQQSIKSALSSAHVREVLIYIQDGINDILKDYVFEFNTVQARLEIKTLVDSFLESVKQDQGVYDFKNIMDSTNNDSEVIDNNMGIIDTYVEPVKGLEIVVHRTTVLNTGEIAAGSFL